MTRVYSRFSGCDTVGCSANGKHLCQQWSHGESFPPWHSILFYITTRSIQPSYLRPSSLPYISIVILPMQCSSLLTICPYQFRILYWISIAISPTFGSSIQYLSFVILSTFVTSHIHHSNFFYCAFCNVPAPILPLSCTASSRVFTFIFCHSTLHRFSSSSSNRSARWGGLLYPVLHLPLTSVPDAYLNAFTLSTVSSCKWIRPRKVYLPPTDLATYQYLRPMEAFGNIEPPTITV